MVQCSDVNKATSHKAKARELKANDFQDSPRPGQCHTATVLNQIKTSDVTYCRASQLFSNCENFIMSSKLNLWKPAMSFA